MTDHADVNAARAGEEFVVVVNPRTLRGPCAGLWDEALARLRGARRLFCLPTAGGSDPMRIATLIASAPPSVVVAAGGDGTVRDVAEALVWAALPTQPALAIVPLGTANNVARSLGLPALRQHGAAAMRCAVDTVLAGREQPLDVGCAGGNLFVGSFAIGMDAAILAARNRWRRRWRLDGDLGGYPLYLLSCAVNLARHRRVAGVLHVDGSALDAPIYDLLILNTALYAGEFRFDGTDHSADARLDLHLFTGPADYVRAFVAAWRRHLRAVRGAPLRPPARMRRVERVEIALARPLAGQLDGEEHRAADRYEVHVQPHAIRVRLPQQRGAGVTPR